MENKENKFEEKFENLKINFENSLKTIEQNVAEKLSKKYQIEQFSEDMKKITNYIEDAEINLKDLHDLIKTK